MSASGLTLLIQRIITVSLFQLVRLLSLLVQNIVWHFDGTAQKARDAFKPDNYETCVRVLNVKACHKLDVIQPITLGDFIYTHNRFETPQYIIDNDHISLMTITPEYAIFGEAREKSMELWRSEYSPFLRLAQMDNCNKLLIVPTYAFNRSAERIGNPTHELIFLFNVARCGSTLLTQMMEYSGQCVAFSEPEAPNMITMWYRKNGDSEQLRQITRSSIRWMCRPYQTIKPMAYFIKLSSSTAFLLHLLKELYPNSSYLFMYREMITVAKSIYKLTREIPIFFLITILGRIHESFTAKCFEIAGFDGKEMRIRIQDNTTFGLALWIYMTKSYMEFYHEGSLNVRAVRYEDIISDPMYAIKAILKHCNLPESLAENALKGMEHDSQRNSPVSREILKKHRDPILTLKGREVINSLAKMRGVPQLGEETILPGTITFKEK